MLFEMPFAKPVAPLYFVGDSNSLLYRHLTFNMPDYFARPIVTIPHYVPALSAASILSEAQLHANILAFFERELVIEYDGRWVPYGAKMRRVDYRQWVRSVLPPLHDVYTFDAMPPVVIMVGAIDLGFLMGELGPGTDFAFEDERFDGTAFPDDDLHQVPSGTVRRLVADRLEPVGTALRLLREMGFVELYLHSVLPPTIDDARYYRLRHVMCTAKVRYKTAILMNRTYEQLARQNGARFLDAWPASVIGGVVDPALELDGDHLNRTAVDRTLPILLRDLIAKRGEPAPA